MKKLIFIMFLLISVLSFGKGFHKGEYTDVKTIESIGVREPYFEKIEIAKDEVRFYLWNSGENSFFSPSQAVIRCYDDNCPDCEYSEVKLNVIYNDYYKCYVMLNIPDDFINSLKKHNEVWVEVKYHNKDGNLRLASGWFSCKNFTKMYDWLMSEE